MTHSVLYVLLVVFGVPVLVYFSAKAWTLGTLSALKRCRRKDEHGS